MMHIERLIVIAGPSGCGKSTLIQYLRAGNFLPLAERLGMDDLSGWQCIEAGEFRQGCTAPTGRVIFHYNLLRQWRPELFTASLPDRALNIFDMAGDMTLTTLWASPCVLIQRIESRQIPFALSLLKKRRFHQFLLMLKRVRQVRRLYANPSALVRQYNHWIEFCRTYHTHAHWLIDTTSDVPVSIDIAAWPDLLEQSSAGEGWGRAVEKSR